MTDRLKNKVALITGGSSGLGLATVKRFLAEGAKIVIADIQDSREPDFIAKAGNDIHFVRCDVTKESDMENAVAAAVQTFGGLDILFNNAGGGGDLSPLRTISAEGFTRTMTFLATSVAMGMKYAAPAMKARGGGSIINVASTAALEAGWGPIAYSAGKAAVIQLTVIGAAELACDKIRVNTVTPGLIMTPLAYRPSGNSEEDKMRLARVSAAAADLQPIRRAGQPDDIANAVLFLASDESTFITGTNTIVDGGMTVGGRHAWDPESPSPLMKARTGT
jgi:NAD(P)-dependent dehydrogenase (short-subunit alcohol dehydrogenase family)